MVCQCFLNTIAYSVLAYVVYSFFKTFYKIFYPFYLASAVDFHKLAGAKWAVITGATDGIGKAYAFELAKKGFNIVLVSRTQSKLDATKEELAQKFPNVEIKTIAFDFTLANLDDYNKNLLDELKKLEIGVLVNNVGVSYEFPEVVHKIEGGNERLRDLVVVNTLPTTILTATVLSQMASRHKGIVINISSSAAFAPMQLLATYSATKKYVNHFTETVRREYYGQGITIQTVCPMMVATKLSKIRRSSFFAPFPEFFVKQALRTVGYVSETTGCFAHEIQALLFALPDFLVDYIIAGEHKKIRAIALKKRSKTE